MALEPHTFAGQTAGSQDQLVSLEPVHNLLYSLVLLYKEEFMPGLGEWVVRTKDAMTLEERQRHRLVIGGLLHAFVPDTSWQSFAGFADHLATLRPETLQDRLLTVYSSSYCCGVDERTTDRRFPRDKAEILSSTDRYLAFLCDRFGAESIDHDLEAQAYRYVIDPPAMQTLIVNHLRSMWDRYLAAEWSRVRTMLDDSVKAFRPMNLGSLPRLELVKTVADRDLPNPQWSRMVEDANRVVLVPNAHVGPYLGKLYTANALVVVFGARHPEGACGEVPDLTRTEIVTRLNALADDNRLRILRLVAERGEVRSAEVMERLDISQSCTSRHLTQLTANGYLVERRWESGKCYSLNPTRIEETLRAISRFLRVPCRTVVGPADIPKEVKR